MNKEITIIEVINKIANREEVPQKIKYKDKIYIYSETDQDYLECGEDDFYLFRYVFCNLRTRDFINDKVEILEEDKDIEEIELLEEKDKNGNKKYYLFAFGNKYPIRIVDIYLAAKLNEVIKEVNKLRKENEEYV